MLNSSLLDSLSLSISQTSTAAKIGRTGGVTWFVPSRTLVNCGVIIRRRRAKTFSVRVTRFCGNSTKSVHVLRTSSSGGATRGRRQSRRRRGRSVLPQKVQRGSGQDGGAYKPVRVARISDFVTRSFEQNWLNPVTLSLVTSGPAILPEVEARVGPAISLSSRLARDGTRHNNLVQA